MIHSRPLVFSSIDDCFAAMCVGALEEDEYLGVQHNQAAEQGQTDVLTFQGTAQQQRGQYGSDCIHFICFVQSSGVIYELDGLKEHPVAHGECTADELLQKSVAVMQQKFVDDPHRPMQMMVLGQPCE